jgi:hypothetical protein
MPRPNLDFVSSCLRFEFDLLKFIGILPSAGVNIEPRQHLKRNQRAIQPQFRILGQAVQGFYGNRQAGIPDQLGDGNVNARCGFGFDSKALEHDNFGSYIILNRIIKAGFLCDFHLLTAQSCGGKNKPTSRFYFPHPSYPKGRGESGTCNNEAKKLGQRYLNRP